MGQSAPKPTPMITLANGEVGWTPALALAVSSVRYPILERIFDYVCTVRSATAGTVPIADMANLRQSLRSSAHDRCSDQASVTADASYPTLGPTGFTHLFKELKRLRKKTGSYFRDLCQFSLLVADE